MTPRKNRTEIFEEVIYYCAIPIDSDNLYDKVTRYIQVNYLILLKCRANFAPRFTNRVRILKMISVKPRYARLETQASILCEVSKVKSRQF